MKLLISSLVVTLLFSTACADNQVSEVTNVVESVFAAAQRGDSTMVVDNLISTHPVRHMVNANQNDSRVYAEFDSSLKQAWRDVELEISKVSITGKSATVSAELRGNGEATSVKFKLRQEFGAWRLASLPELINDSWETDVVN